jgi:hypothetical protein
VSNFVIWQRPPFPPARTVDWRFDGDGELGGQQGGLLNAGTAYPFKPSIDAPDKAFGGGRVGMYHSDLYLRLIPFPKPPRNNSGLAPSKRSFIGQTQNPWNNSRGQGPGAPGGGR